MLKRNVSLTISSRLPIGTNLFELNWDLLIVLDSCRIDALTHAAETGEYPFLSEGKIEAITSVGSATPEWVTATFDNRHRELIRNTALISANAWPSRVLDQATDIDREYGVNSGFTRWNPVPPKTLGQHIPAWQYVDRSETHHPQTNADTVTELGIDLGRKTDFDRYIIHYIEPHYPYVAAADTSGGFTPDTETPIEYLRKNGDYDTVYENYLTELLYGLDHVETLLNNFDADTVILTSDHGEAFGEYPWLGLRRYGHKVGMMHPKVRRVPLMRLTAEDSGEYSPDVDRFAVDEDIDVEDNLSYLGYL